ncbi:MAG: hypothetical protein A2Y67_00605 [Candidatus Buchananbacteria bacterium RBG_13_39_9]|uniref:Uncharacterized protein n=1 Tax=Candidatus Buchananbacteria bacterium RBG_13_39_9 TaxID=1797531 RepID=A0A1G1XMV5_9BACT|nr:MAG: hypothetical protein A2Y67_00605 [Candidatus Buchananbacteria bacterium RBG_13_39_9]
MVETTKDILYLVISFVVLLLTIFICWVIYYLAMILREVKKIVFDARKKIELVEAVLVTLKEKIEHTSSYMKLLVESAGNIVEFLKDRKAEKSKKRKK